MRLLLMGTLLISPASIMARRNPMWYVIPASTSPHHSRWPFSSIFSFSLLHCTIAASCTPNCCKPGSSILNYYSCVDCVYFTALSLYHHFHVSIFSSAYPHSWALSPLPFISLVFLDRQYGSSC